MGAQACMTYSSLLRYPAGKAGFAKFLPKTLEMNDLSGCDYLEPLAGAAGVALRLLRNGIVSNLYLNRLDHCTYAFGMSIFNQAERLADRILSIPINIKEWKKQSNIFHSTGPELFQVSLHLQIPDTAIIGRHRHGYTPDGESE